ncbi:gluconate 2-dehydrogenase subunit 3 family protein [Haladaptatus sp. DJG-WS-42]|uniref:gluconate 2-dehydrogenase subunit 3 family protein n=1 Tax=Haladaptatus sp. DJG-WS-42 TaxID=3120516 RepID=UPI0030CF11D2
MELTRRDALSALASVGIVAGGGSAFLASGDDGADVSRRQIVETMGAAADVLYPTEVTGIHAFVETYLTRKIDGRPAYRSQLGRAVVELNETAQDWYDAPFAELSVELRTQLLVEMGIPEADPSADPGETTARRLRYYIWNDLQYALYSSPTGGRLVGIENPQGHPGGLTYTKQP